MSGIVLPTGEIAPRAVDELHATVGPSSAPACRWMDDTTIGAYYVRWAAGRALLDEILPVLTRLRSWERLPYEHIGDAFLVFVRDWTWAPAQAAVVCALELEKLNAEIIEQQRLQLEEAAAASDSRRPPPRPTRKGKQKRRPKAGRR